MNCTSVLEGDNYGTGKQKTEQMLAFVVLKPAQGSSFSCYLPQLARTEREKHVFRIQHLTAATSPHLTAHGSRLTLRLHAPLSVESPLPSARAVRGLCLEVPLGTREPDPSLINRFFFAHRK